MKIIHKNSLDSTNAYARENMKKLEDRTFIHCNIQTNGKGQFERSWISDVPDNLYLTIVLKPNSENAKTYPLANLTMYMANVVCAILKTYGVKPDIKPPNDIIINGAKIAGILAQSSTKGQKINGIALGVGVNLNLTNEQLGKIDKKATALNLETGNKIDRDEFFNKLAKEFLLGYDDFIKNGLREDLC